MKKLLGLVMIVSGACLGLYVGGYLCLIKGIIQIIQSVTPAVIASGIAWGIGKIVFAGFLGSLSAMMLCVPGYVMMQD